MQTFQTLFSFMQNIDYIQGSWNLSIRLLILYLK